MSKSFKQTCPLWAQGITKCPKKELCEFEHTMFPSRGLAFWNCKSFRNSYCQDGLQCLGVHSVENTVRYMQKYMIDIDKHIKDVLWNDELNLLRCRPMNTIHSIMTSNQGLCDQRILPKGVINIITQEYLGDSVLYKNYIKQTVNGIIVGDCILPYDMIFGCRCNREYFYIAIKPSSNEFDVVIICEECLGYGGNDIMKSEILKSLKYQINICGLSEFSFYWVNRYNYKLLDSSCLYDIKFEINEEDFKLTIKNRVAKIE